MSEAKQSVIRELKDLRVYQQAMELAQGVHDATLAFPAVCAKRAGAADALKRRLHRGQHR